MESRKNDQDNDYLSNLPDEMLVRIGESSLRTSDFIQLPNTSSRFSLLFFHEHRLALKCLRQLLNHAALGEWEDAEGIWKVFPDLLTQPGTIYHSNPIEITPEMNPGRYQYVNRTAWQIALMNEEYEEAEMMGEYMTQEEKQKQFAEIFPDGTLTKHNWDLAEAKRRVEAVFAAMIEDTSIDGDDLDTMNETTRSALNALYQYVKPALNHQTGLVFDATIYVHALMLYDNYDDFDKDELRSFWCIRVEEYLASLLGTGYLRHHTQGIGNELKRVGCTLEDGSPYFAFRRSAHSVPGFHFFIGVSGWLHESDSCREGSKALEFFQELGEAKMKARTEIMQRYARIEEPSCLRY